MIHRTPPRSLFLILPALLLGLIAHSGCNIVAPVALAIEGPPTIDPEYELPDRTTVVFVDDRRNVLTDFAIRRYIGDKVSEQLLRQKAVKDAISTGDALVVAGREQTGALMPLEQIAAEVGAAQLIYIELLRFSMASADGTPVAQAELHVKVIDAENRSRLYPPEDGQNDARFMIVTLPAEQAFQPLLGRGARREAEYTLADMVADKVSKLFYEHERGIPLGHRSSPSPAR